MVDYLPRTAWGARPAESGPGLLTVSRVEGAVIHWPGSSDTDGIHSLADVAAALRGWQRFHMDDRGWSDIAYQVAVDQAGRAWTLRGLRTQSGANGNNDLNERYGAILLVLVAGEQPTPAMRATTRGVLADFREIYPRGTAIEPHSAVRPDGTTCPGPAARAAIARGDFTPGTTQEDELMASQYETLLEELRATREEVRDMALWIVLHGLEAEDERAQALAAYNAKIAAGGSVVEAKAAAYAVLRPLAEAIRRQQS